MLCACCIHDRICSSKWALHDPNYIFCSDRFPFTSLYLVDCGLQSRFSPLYPVTVPYNACVEHEAICVALSVLNQSEITPASCCQSYLIHWSAFMNCGPHITCLVNLGYLHDACINNTWCWSSDWFQIAFLQVIALGQACLLKPEQSSNNDPPNDDETIEAPLLSWSWPASWNAPLKAVSQRWLLFGDDPDPPLQSYFFQSVKAMEGSGIRNADLCHSFRSVLVPFTCALCLALIDGCVNKTGTFGKCSVRLYL